MSVLSFVAFVPWELKQKVPIVDVRLVVQRQFGMSLLVLAVGATPFSPIQLRRSSRNATMATPPRFSRLAPMPGGAIMLFPMPVAGRITNLVQPKYLIATGMPVTAAGLFYMTSLSRMLTSASLPGRSRALDGPGRIAAAPRNIAGAIANEAGVMKIEWSRK